MANFGLGLSQGFQLGMQLGNALRQKRMREEFEEAQKEKQFRKYTQAEGEQMRREAGTVEQPGEYEYTIEPGSIEYTKRKRGISPEQISGGLEMSTASDRVTPYTPEAESTEPVDLSRIFAVPQPYMRQFIDRTGRPYTKQMYDGMMGIMDPLPPNEKQDLLGIPGGPSSGRGLAPPVPVAPAAPAAPSAPTVMTPGAFRGGLSPVDFTRALPSDREAIIRALTTEYGPSETMKPGATEYLGKTYGAEGLTPAQQRSALLNRYADIISTYEGPVEGERFRSMARAEERAEKTFELQTQLTDYQIRAVARSEKEANELEALSQAASKYIAENPAATPRDIVDYVAKTVKPSAGALNKYVSQVAQVDESNLKLLNNKIERQIRGQSLSGLVKIFNEDPDYDPNTNIVQEKGPKGEVIIKVVDAKDPRKILESYSFKDETIARDYLIQTAKNPGTQASWLRTMQLQEDQGIYYRAKAERYAAGRGTGRDYSEVDAAQRVRALTSMRSEYSRDAERLRSQLENMRPNDPNREAVTRQLNDTLNEMRQIDMEMRSYRSGGGGLTRGGGAAPKRYSIGDIEEATTTDGKKVKVKLVRGDGSREEDWEVLAPSSTKAEPKAEAEVKTAPAKEEPKAKAAPAPKAQIEITKELRAKIDKERLEMSEGNRMKYSPEVGAAVKQIQEEENLAQTKRREEEARRQIERDKQRLQGLTR